MRLTKCLLTGLLVLGIVAGALAEEDFKKLPGYVDFDSTQVLGLTEPVVQVFVDRPLLKMASTVTEGSDPQVSELLSKVELVRVQVFSIEGDQAKKLEEKVSELAKNLQKDGWVTVVRVREDEEAVNILLKTVKDSIAGLVVLVVEPEQAVFVNIAGELDLALLGKLGHGLNLDVAQLSNIKLPEEKAVAEISGE